jgi:murein L,D-transpeptidase YcbB/YkuD
MLHIPIQRFLLHFIKTIFILTITISLAVAIEAMTINTANQLNSVNNSFQEASSNYQNFNQNVTLSEIIYSEKSTKMLMDMLINNEAKTFSHLSHKKFIQKIYQENRYLPFWFNSYGIKRTKVDGLFRAIDKDITLNENGRIRKQFHYLNKKIKNTKKRLLAQELKLDLELSSLYRTYIGYHISGGIDWWSFQKKLSKLRKNKIAANWATNNPRYDITNLMVNYPLSHVLSVTTPNSFGYTKMIKELKRLRTVQKQGGWKKIPNSSRLSYGKSGTVVTKLKHRLKSEGDYTCKQTNGQYDQCLKKAVKRFQKRHGIYASGAINRATRKKLNLSVDWKIKKLLLNIDRIKRLPDQPEDRYIMVNIPDFKLYYKENGKEKLTMRVIVGDKTHHTPIFSNKISFIVLNPYWLIPDSIVQKEMIPKMLKNPNYLKERGYEVRMNYDFSKLPIETSKIDWAKALRNGQTKKYKFMQPPGPKNALGKIKFKFPNRFAVYLHDTPTKKLFKKGWRTFSHGCIRIEKPSALLKTFAKHENSVNYSRSQKILRGKNKTQLNLSKKVPVHIVYLTAWINSDGLLHYRPDVYGYDSKQHRSNY